MQKCQFYFYMSNKIWKFKFTIASKNGILKINLTKYLQDLYPENYKTLQGETEKGLNK